VTVTPGQLAAARGVSERTVRRWIAKGALPSGMTAEQTPDGWRIAVADARVIDCQTLNDVTGQGPDTVTALLQARIGALETELAAARDRETWLRQRVEKAEVDRDRADEERRELVARVPLALPAAPVEQGWWRRLFGGGDR